MKKLMFFVAALTLLFAKPSVAQVDFALGTTVRDTIIEVGTTAEGFSFGKPILSLTILNYGTGTADTVYACFHTTAKRDPDEGGNGMIILPQSSFSELNSISSINLISSNALGVAVGLHYTTGGRP